jgi:hypothetical protein
LYHIAINFTNSINTYIYSLIMNTERLPQGLNPDRNHHNETQRVKSVFFAEPITSLAATAELVDIWSASKKSYITPLAQVRAILPYHQEESLILKMRDLQDKIEGDAVKVGIIGRIPFQLGNDVFGIYYLQIESKTRKTFSGEGYMAHSDAVVLGFNKRQNHRPAIIPDGFSIHAIGFAGHQPLDYLTGERLNFNLNQLSYEIAQVHSSTFEYAHDPAQRTVDGAREILQNNPTLIAVDRRGKIASVGYLERDPRFTFGNIALVEPTYFTLSEYRSLGLSSLLRQTAMRLVKMDRKVSAYNDSPMIIFNESIRHTSFPLCIANGYSLAGTQDLTIPGDLGNAYTAIGKANPDAGYMPLGLTYATNPHLETGLI